MEWTAKTLELAGLGLLGGAAALGTAGYYAFVSPAGTLWGKAIHRAPESGGTVAITLDDGPSDPGSTRALDILADLGVPATFFVIGRNVERFPHLLRRMHEQGHLIGNHSYDHETFGSFHHTKYWIKQIAQAQDAICQVIGRQPILFRPPMGIRTWPIAQAANRQGVRIVTWTHRGLDGIRPRTPRILRRLLSPARGGDILVLHDGSVPGSRRDASATTAALGPLIEGLRQRGLRPVRLDEMLGIAGYADAAVGPMRTPPAAHADAGASHASPARAPEGLVRFNPD